jgi:hypothetical protein
MAGAYVSMYLLAAAFCIPNAGFSTGWSKLVGIGLLLIFLLLTHMDHEQGEELSQRMHEGTIKALKKNMETEQSGSVKSSEP